MTSALLAELDRLWALSFLPFTALPLVLCFHMRVSGPLRFVVKGEGKRVLVTGGNGYLGSAVVLAFLEAGFRVRATTRSKEKAERWERRHPSLAGAVDWRVVPSFTSSSSCPSPLSSALSNVHLVAHTASQVDYSQKGRAVVDTAVQGALGVLRAAKAAGGVERVVLTSSASAVVDGVGIYEAGRRFMEDDWAPTTEEHAEKSGVMAYQVGKKLAEKAAWDFMAAEGKREGASAEGGFGLTTLCPGMIYGPPTQAIESMHQLNTSLRDLWSLVDAKQLPQGTPYPICSDVRNIADLHVLAATSRAAHNQRYLTIAHSFTFSEVAEMIRSDPELTEEQRRRIPSEPKERRRKMASVDSGKVVRDLGVKWRTLDTTVRESMRELFRLEEECKSRK